VRDIHICVRALALLLLAACGASASKPLAAVDAYAAALRAGDYSRAYDYMSEHYRREHSRAEFVKRMQDSTREAKETASRLTSSNRRVELSAKFLYDDLRDELPLVVEDGQWRIASDPLDFYPQDTPAHSLRSFVRAVELKRWEIVLRFVPERWRKEMTVEKVRDQFEGTENDETRQMIRLLTANLDNPIETQGDEARMPYGERFEVKFVREDGVWKIADPD
jgi:hypothetical protein